MQWIYGQVGGIPRWMIALALLGAFLAWQHFRSSRRTPAPPDGGFEVYPMPTKRYRTTRGRRAA